MLQQTTDLEHLVQTELVNRLPTTREKTTVSSVAFETTVFVVVCVSVHTQPTPL